MIKKFKIFLILVSAFLIFSYVRFRPSAEPEWGVNFSIPHASYLGFDWRQMYVDILRELRPKYLRTMAYWEIVEPVQNEFNFSELDFMLQEASAHGVKVLLVLGFKQPRWPECHAPEWAKEIQNAKFKTQNLLEYIETVVKRYKNNEAVYAWQVENEPFFPYGPDCGSVGRKLYKEELELVKSLDTRPIVVTDSGEKGAWLPTVWAGGDIFGSTMYREVYHHKKKRYLKYPLPYGFYRLKAGIVRVLSGVDNFIGVELQAEPWFGADDVHKTPWEEQERHMNPDIFRSNVRYASKVGFAQNYFWGVEWWYWAKSEGHPEMWEAAKDFITNN